MYSHALVDDLYLRTRLGCGKLKGVRLIGVANKTWDLRRLWAFAKINNSVSLSIIIVLVLKVHEFNRVADASPRAHAHGVTRK